MVQSYILKGTENEYLLVIKSEDQKIIYSIIDLLATSRNKQVRELAIELEKSMNDNGRDSSKAGSKNKSKSSNSNNNKRRKTKDTQHRIESST
jgi:hypothetical protein